MAEYIESEFNPCDVCDYKRCSNCVLHELAMKVSNFPAANNMQDYILTVEFSMSNIPNSEDFKNCIQDAFVNYCKKHPEEKVTLKYMHLKFDEQTLCHQDASGNWYLPNVEKKMPVKRIWKGR